MSTSQPERRAEEAEETPDTVGIPIPPGMSLQPRAARASRRIHKAVGVWPWDIIPECPPKMWAINLVEDLALVTEHVAKSSEMTLDDLRVELRKSISRDRKPSYAGRLMAQDIQAAKKRFVQGHREVLSDRPVSKGTPPSRRSTISATGQTPTPSRSQGFSSMPNGDEDDDPSSITVASAMPTSPALPRSVKVLKRPAPAAVSSPEKRGRVSSPDGSRLSAAQSLMLFSSPMATFHMPAPARSGGTPLNTTATHPLPSRNVQEPLQSATSTYLAAIDSHIQHIRASYASAQQEVFAHRSTHQDSVRKHRTCEAQVHKIQLELEEAREKQGKLLEETAEQAALAPQLQALQENNMSLPPEIAQAIRSYESRRASKSEEVRKHEAVIETKTAELDQARSELQAAEEESSRLDSGIQGLHTAVSRGIEAARLAELFAVMVRLGPEGLANIERMYPEIGTLLQTLLAAEGAATQEVGTAEGDGIAVDPALS